MSNAQRGKRAFAASIIMLASSTLAGCVSTVMPRAIKTQTVMQGERPVVLGSQVRSNTTPMEAPLACLAGSMNLAHRRPLVIGVGDVKDYTGRYSINEGNVVTQGGALMLYSALAKLGGSVRVAERYDPAIGERELAYMDRRQLGNGTAQQVDGKTVPWVPYFGGSIQGSDYYIVGGITEANANVSSGGADVAVNNVGVKRRTYTQSVAIDLRIVDSRSLLVVDAVSLQKQYTGYEVGANTFRFFGLDLFDVTLGAKAQEPMQLGIRATIEEAALLLVSRVNQIDAKPCLELVGSRLPTETSEQFLHDAAAGKVPTIATAAARSAGIALGAPAVPASPPRPSPRVALAKRQQPPARELPPVRQAPPASAPPAVRLPAPAKPPVQARAPLPVMASIPARAAIPAQVPLPTRTLIAPTPPLASAVPQAANAGSKPLNQTAASGDATSDETLVLTYEIGEIHLPGTALGLLDRIVTLARKGGVMVALTTRDNESALPAQRTRMLDARIAVLTAALANRGISSEAISIEWRPDSTDSTVYHQGAGLQVLARIKIRS